jgi:hypothetical protein
MRFLALLLPALLFGCEKITVRECDDANHVDANGPDMGPNDKDANNVDGGNDLDGGVDPDAAEEDASNPTCNSGGYCIEALTASAPIANVREAVMFTPTVRDNGETLMFSGTEAEIVASRRSPLPAFDASDVTITFTVDPSTGTAQFIVNEVPTWFTTTTFTVRVHGQSQSGPDVYADASVTIRGNIVVSGTSEVYAIASDGLPALSVNFTQGRLISGSSFVDEPEDMWLARDGTLLVYDAASTPPRIRNFALDAENSQLPDFDFVDGANMPIISELNEGVGLTQLSDGRVALIDYLFSRPQSSIIHFWNEDGSFSHSINAPNPNTRWFGLAGDDGGGLFVLEQDSNGRLIEIDPATGFELGVVTTDLATAYNVLWRPDGSFYVGLYGSVIRVTPQGGKQMVSGLPGSSDTYRHLSPFGADRVLTTRNSSSEYSNVLIIEDTDNLGYLRREGVGGPVFLPYGVAYLD